MDEDEDFYTVGEMEGGGYVHILRLGPHQCILMYRNAEGRPMLSNKRKKELITFVVAGAFALILGKIEKAVNKKADEYFPDEDE